MALVPTTFMDSFQSSMSKLHFLRYASSIPPKKQSFYKPPKITAFDGTKKVKRWNFGRVSSSCSSWLVNWNETHKEYKLKRPQAVIDYRNNGEASDSDCEEGSSSGSTMERIVQKLKKFGYVDEISDEKETVERKIEKGSVEDIFYVEEGILPNSRGGFSEKPVYPEPGNELASNSNGEVSFPWERPKVNVEDMSSVRRRGRLSFAELTLPESEIQRLRNVALRVKNKTRIKGSVTHEVVEKIHEKWKSSEVVRLKIDGTPALNMKRMHEILERKTGGLVVWRSGTSIALYRGVTYDSSSEKPKHRIYYRNGIPPEASSEKPNKRIYYTNGIPPESSPSAPDDESSSSSSMIDPESESANTRMENRNDPTLDEPNYEEEADHLLDDLGPRYNDWPGHGPLPVDADLLPGVLPGYKPPFRILPYGVRSTLGVKEATSLRRLARVLPPHFALGRSRQHQGLAAAMVKLWERSKIAKVALKRGVQLTTSERIAEDIKKLTGGILLSRNKDFLVFYRGKDFLSTEVSGALLEKERLANTLQDEEEQARLRASAFVTSSMKIADESGTAGTLGETLDADARWGKKLDDDHGEKMMKEAEMLRHANLARKLQSKLFFSERKLVKAERALAKVEEFLNPSEHFADPDSITDEERFMFRKLGLRMKAYLILGRRGVFDGTVENMHLHWKYRELVKIMLKAQSFAEVKAIALSLEAESGGVLVSVDKVSKGYAIIVFRGKDYKRPSRLRPQNLLTKRKALARSIELQRHQALMNHISQLQTRVNALRSEMGQMESVKDRGDMALYDRLDSSYLSEDEDTENDDEDEDEDEEFETSDKSGNSMNNHYSDDSEYAAEEKETEYVES